MILPNSKQTKHIKGKMSHIRFQYPLAFLASGNAKILLPEFFINLDITIRPLLHPKALV